MTSQRAPEDGAWVQYPDGSIWSRDGTRCAVSAYASATCGRAGDYYECAGVTSEVKLRIIPEVLEALNRSAASPSPPPGVGEPDFWAVHSRTGMHIGLWPDKVLAEGVLRQYEGGTMTPLFRAPPVGVDVVKLEWDNLEMAGGYGTIVAVSRTPFGKYVIEKEVDDDGAYNGNIRLTLTGQVLINLQLATVEAAKSAAQADFERRVRSALVPSPLLKEAEEALRLLRDAHKRTRMAQGLSEAEADALPSIYRASDWLARLGAAP